LSQSDLNNETKVKLQKMFGEKFVVLLAPLKKKLKKAESIIKETKNKYKEKVINLIYLFNCKDKSIY